MRSIIDKMLRMNSLVVAALILLVLFIGVGIVVVPLINIYGFEAFEEFMDSARLYLLVFRVSVCIAILFFWSAIARKLATGDRGINDNLYQALVKSRWKLAVFFVVVEVAFNQKFFGFFQG